MSIRRTSNDLTSERFAAFLAWLSPEQLSVGEEYERLRFRLVTYFAHRNCRFPEDLTDETIDRIARKIADVPVENKTAYVYGFAKNVFLESLRKEKNHENIDDHSIAMVDTDQESDESDRTHSNLEKCLAELSNESRKLILEYFSEEKQAKIGLHRSIAQRLNTTQVALRMRIVRIKRSLKLCMQACAAIGS